MGLSQCRKKRFPDAQFADGQPVDAKDARELTLPDLLLQQAARTAQDPYLGDLLEVKRRVGRGVPGHQPRAGARRGVAQDVMLAVDGQTQVGQNDQNQAQTD
jgi:hypothetical protein